MKKKTAPKKQVQSKRWAGQFDSTEFLLLAFVAVVLLVIFLGQTGMLPFTASVLGASTSR